MQSASWDLRFITNLARKTLDLVNSRNISVAHPTAPGLAAPLQPTVLRLAHHHGVDASTQALLSPLRTRLLRPVPITTVGLGVVRRFSTERLIFGHLVDSVPVAANDIPKRNKNVKKARQGQELAKPDHEIQADHTQSFVLPPLEFSPFWDAESPVLTPASGYLELLAGEEGSLEVDTMQPFVLPPLEFPPLWDAWSPAPIPAITNLELSAGEKEATPIESSPQPLTDFDPWSGIDGETDAGEADNASGGSSTTDSPALTSSDISSLSPPTVSSDISSFSPPIVSSYVPPLVSTPTTSSNVSPHSSPTVSSDPSLHSSPMVSSDLSSLSSPTLSSLGSPILVDPSTLNGLFTFN
ncbi:hypothetical protein BDN72DRAFT_553106 [Pluteus cervinus]|uniref:Uncharacterized protein n=1 Tax=Pluteus cervinus TaxID=181527 RepID=A0ACD3AXE1_9AGAR|nr:hypothetical protein BDN72DRAFT_553106 [Pluteus cervinus]